jgi:hypothetical protein
VVYVVMLVPAVIAAAFSWRWWIAAALVLPGFVLYVTKSWAAAQAQGVTSQGDTGQWLVDIIVVPIAVVLAGVVRAHAERFSILILVCCLIVVVDPLGRVVWHRRRRGDRSDARSI